MTTMRTFLASLALPLALAACGGSTQDAAAPAPESSAPTTSASQWASALSGSELMEAWANVEDSCGPLFMDLASPTCGANLMTLDYTALGLRGKFDDLHAKGDPEPEVADLVIETRESLADVEKATSAWHAEDADCLMSDSDQCHDLAMGVWRAMSTFPGEEWTPYL